MRVEGMLVEVLGSGVRPDRGALCRTSVGGLRRRGSVVVLVGCQSFGRFRGRSQ